jgi:hypothetical protein
MGTARDGGGARRDVPVRADQRSPDVLRAATVSAPPVEYNIIATRCCSPLALLNHLR